MEQDKPAMLENAVDLQRDGKSYDELYIVANGQKWSYRASTVCLTLACCDCDNIPAFLFSRPYSNCRRWDSTGAVKIAHPALSEVPQWASGLFHEIDEGQLKDDADLGFSFPPSDLGLYIGHGEMNSRLHHYSLSEDVQFLFKQSIIHNIVDEGLLYFKIAEDWKQTIRRKCSINDYIGVLSSLLKLTIFAFPDMHTEALWQCIRLGLSKVIKSTLLPFLSVIEWREFQEFKTILAHLFSFLAQYSICEGFGRTPSVPFGPGILSRLDAIRYQPLRGFGLLMTFKDQICVYLTKTDDEDDNFRKLMTAAVAPCFEDVVLSALLGFMIDLLFGSITSVHAQAKLNALAEWWQAEQKSCQSTIGGLAEILLSAKLRSEKTLSIRLEGADFQIRTALGFALAEHKSFSFAQKILENCVKEVEATFSNKCFEYGLILAELIKCHNALKEEAEGESWGLQAVQNRTSTGLVGRIDTIYLMTALADCYIGQSKYHLAEPLLSDMLEEGSLSAYLTVIVALRLNKVRRRLGDTKTLKLSKSSTLWKALNAINDVQQSINLDFMEELISTINHLTQGGLIAAPEARKLVVAATNKLVCDPTLTKDWRFCALKKQQQALLCIEDFMLMKLREEKGPILQSNSVAEQPFNTVSGVEGMNAIPDDEQRQISASQLTNNDPDIKQIPPTISTEWVPEAGLTYSNTHYQARNARARSSLYGDYPKPSPTILFPTDIPISADDVQTGQFIVNPDKPQINFFGERLQSTRVQVRSVSGIDIDDSELNAPISPGFFRGDRASKTTFTAKTSRTYECIQFDGWIQRVSSSLFLKDWIRKQKEVYVIREYQTYIDAEIIEEQRIENPRQNSADVPKPSLSGIENSSISNAALSSVEGEHRVSRAVQLAGEKVGAICVHRVVLKEALEYYGIHTIYIHLEPFSWKTYWGPVR